MFRLNESLQIDSQKMPETEREWQQKSIDDVLHLLDHGGALNRARALEELIDRSRKNAELLFTVEKAIRRAENKNARLMGTISVAHGGMAALFKTPTQAAIVLAQKLLSEWENPDRQDLLWFLQSEGVDASLTEPILQAA